jgi:hypothetical protein
MKLTNLILSNDESTVMRILVLTGFAWLPLVILTFIDGTLFNKDITMPFVKDVAPYVRCLVVIPLLVIADNIIEPMMARVTRYLNSSGLVPDTEMGKLNGAIDKMARLLNDKWILLVLLMLAIFFSFIMRSDYDEMWTERGVTSWMLELENGVVDETFAGTWFLLVASPLVSFLVYRWVWRFIIWSIFLRRVSTFKIELLASHSDLAGGLGVIGKGQVLFIIVFFILATLLSSDLAANMLYEDEVLVSVKQVVVVFIVISIIVILLPLMFFTGQLIDLKHRSLAEYSKLQNQISKDFHKHWIKDEADDMVDSIQPSAMADYSAVFDNVSNLRVIPVDSKMIIAMAGILLVPFLPLALIETSIWAILQKIGGTLI